MHMPVAMDRRSFLRGVAGGAVGVAGAAVLGSCSSSSAGPVSGKTSYLTKPGTGIGKGTPVRGGQLTMATGSEIDGFDPTASNWDATGLQYAGTIYDQLAALAPDGTVHGYLAESITPNAEYDAWTIQMRPNVMFHNGKQCDAAAVKENLDAFVSSLLTGAAFNNVEKSTVTGPLTVVVTTKTPWVAFPTYLTSQVGTIAEPSTLGGSAATHPIGTGPFIFSDWVANSHFTSTRNPNYWRPGLPYLDTMQYTPIVDTQSQENALLSGSTDVIQSSYTQTLVDLWNRPGFQVIDDLGSPFEPSMDSIMLNTAVPPFDNPKVRLALAYGANPELIIKDVWNGIPPLATGPFVAGSPYYSPTGYPTYNPAKATQLVKEIENETGHPIPTFQFDTIPSAQYVRINELVQAMWAKVGITCQINQVQQAQLIQNALTGKYQATAWQQFNTPDPDGNYVWWSSKSVSPVGSLSLNMARNSDPLIQQALQTGRESTDQQTRIAAYEEVARRFAVDLPYLWSNPAVWMVGAANYVQNFNGPTFPGGAKRLGMISGIISVAEMWRSS
jgi:peptide/nickel transport system substrate-binding protein